MNKIPDLYSRTVLANCDRRKKKKEKSYWFQFPKINTVFYRSCRKRTKELKIIRQVTAYSGRQVIKNNSVFLQFFQVIFPSLIISSNIYMKIGSWFLRSLSAFYNYPLEVIILVSVVISFSISFQWFFQGEHCLVCNPIIASQ